MRLPFITTILLILVNKALLFNILAILPYAGKSHFIIFDVLIKELASKDHNLTVISHFPTQNPPKNYKDISLAKKNNAIEGSFRTEVTSLYRNNYYLTTSGIQDCEVMLANKGVQSLIKSKQQFDVILVELFNSDCALGVAYKIGAPVVGITSNGLMSYHFKRFGIPDNPSYVPLSFFGGGNKPTLIQRLQKTFFKFYYAVMYSYTQWRNQRTLAKYFDDIPPLEELGREIKILLLYQNFMLTGSYLRPANAIEVGGFHVKKTKPLTGELKKFVDEARDGLVYISFGSMLNSSTFPSHKLQAFLETMKELPYRFILKWDSYTLMEDKNKLYTSSWLPQADILVHPNTLAFISHGGIGSTNEALYSGVPMIAMPFFGDQFFNAAAIEESCFGIQLQYEDLTKENLVAALNKVLDLEFRKKSQEVAKAWRDRPTSPLDTAVFWTEFAAKHPNFTYRTAAADVPLYQYLYLDVMTTFVVVLGVFGFIIHFCCTFVCRSKQGIKPAKKTN